jgi:hypothetical protein
MFPAQEKARTAARELFLEHPGLSVFEAARRLKADGHGLDTNDISGIRRDVRERISFGGQKGGTLPPMHDPEVLDRIQPKIRKRIELQGSAAPVPQANPFNAIRFPTLRSLPAGEQQAIRAQPLPTPPLAEPQKPAPEPMIATLERIPPEPPRPPTGSLEQQKVWLDTWALENPFKSVAKTTETIKTTFGLCLLSPSYIAGVIKVARELYEDQHKAVAPPSPAPISQRPRDMMELAMAMQEMGIKKIELIDGAVRVEMGPNT